MKNTQHDTDRFFDIPYYHDFISAPLARHLLRTATKVEGVSGLVQVESGGGLESADGMRFLTTLYERIKDDLALVLRRRTADRKFIDERVRACFEFNQKVHRDILDPTYKTVIGLEDAEGRMVFGPKSDHFCNKGGRAVAPIPKFLQGPHVTLFGPPDSAKLAINAMNAYHRKLKGEPAIVAELLAAQAVAPKWGADDEDSKTPLRRDLVDAAVNLTGCFDKTLRLSEGDKSYQLAADHLAAPLKRFPGLALPCAFLFYFENPIPLHLYDFALHLFRNWNNPEALAFYVPKLENEEEARYIHTMIAAAESMVKALHPEYQLGTVRVMIVLENPRAILRAHEIMDELEPYFLGASLGWHDYLASTARLFKEDGNYRIPVKADPNIVIKYIKASHDLLADVVGSRGGIKVGGMYGILPQNAEITSPSFQVALKGFFKDVITQLKRDLTGFWVAHPDFVRLGLAIVEAWERYKSGDETPLFTLTKEIFGEGYRAEVDGFIRGQDIVGLDRSNANYVRSLLVADIKDSDYIANHHPDEIRYNIFQSLQYLTDWLSGNGCVALPTIVEGIPVRVMDDLATAERSRWEVWHELRHKRFALEDFLRIAHEELRFIRKDLSDAKKIVQVKWDERTAKWYPIAFRIMVQLMTAEHPVEFATELLLPFTVEEIRESQDPWTAAMKIDSARYALNPYIERWNYYFERCGSQRFATVCARQPFLDRNLVATTIDSVSVDEMIEAASFHGDIGESPKTLDHLAQGEQRLVSNGEDALKTTLRSLGVRYRESYGFKFLVSAQGKSPEELIAIIRERSQNTRATEIELGKEALRQIALKRIGEHPLDGVYDSIQLMVGTHQIVGAQIAVAVPEGSQTIAVGDAVKSGQAVHGRTLFELASLSKTIAAAFAMEFFAKRHIPLTASVNGLFVKTPSQFRLYSTMNPTWGDAVTVADLIRHTALNLHYVKGFPVDTTMVSAGDIIQNGAKYGYDAVSVVAEPGSTFKYSGGGFLVLEHLLESMEGASIYALTKPFIEGLGLVDLTFQQQALPGRDYAHGYRDDGGEISGGRLMFPALAAGAMGSAESMLGFLRHLGHAFHDLHGSGPISHDTAVIMLRGRDLGCRAFMGCDMGLGAFVAEMGDNRVALHQGANDGFRAIYVYVFSGPDVGKGFVVLCNGDNRGVPFVAEVSRYLIGALCMSGVDFTRVASSFDYANLSQEQIVNLGYKNLVFKAFEPMRPEKIVVHGARDPLADRNLLHNATVVAVSNDRFARAENLMSPYEPKFDPELFGRQGKIMDSWESVRHNEALCDTLQIKLQKSGRVAFVQLSTKYHDGNQAQFVRILGRGAADSDWFEILPKIGMTGHAWRRVRLAHQTPEISEVLVEMYPDGGLSRVGLYEDLAPVDSKTFNSIDASVCTRYADAIPKSHKPLTIGYNPTTEEIASNIARSHGEPMDWASAAHGGSLVRASNEHYGPAVQVISPFPPIHMFDGLESARSRDAGQFEEVVIKLGRIIPMARVVLDFTFFTNNNPSAVSIFALVGTEWRDLVGVLPVKAFAANKKEIRLGEPVLCEQVMVRTWPDGGINRIHVYEK